MTDFTFAQAASALGISYSAFSHRARKANMPFRRGPNFNARLITLEDLERIAGRTLSNDEIARLLATTAQPTGKEAQRRAATRERNTP